MAAGGIVAGVIIAVVVVFFVVTIIKAVIVVREKEHVIIERLGRYHRTLTAGIHFIVPWLEYPKSIYYRYYVSTPNGSTELRKASGIKRINIQNEVLDFPKQQVITKDNALISLDAVLSYKVVNSKQMVYSVQNLPNVLSLLLQALMRNVAGTLDVDQIIEEAAALNVLTGLMDAECQRWGVQVSFVKIQKVEAPSLEGVLAAKKNADLKNKEVVISAKSYKQSKIIESEGTRDSNVKKAEGDKLSQISSAKGQARAIINNAEAEARSIREIARGVSAEQGSDPLKYLLSLKYLDALTAIAKEPNTSVIMQPKETSFVQTSQDMGFNTIMPQRIKQE